MKKFNCHLFFKSIMMIQFIVLFYAVELTGQSETLPNPLIRLDGSKVTNIKTWLFKRRPELLNLFETIEYGKTPGTADSISSKIVSSKLIMDGKAKMNQISLKVFIKGKYIIMNLLEIKPTKIEKPLTCFVGLNFDGNQTVLSDTSIRITDKWLIEYGKPDIVNNHATSLSRGIDSAQWSVRMIIEQGYALITCHSADIDEDRVNYDDGAQSLFYKDGQSKPASGEWGTIGAWAWGMSRMLDYVTTCKYFNSNTVIAIGHSRLGKTALWAAAQDKRFAAVISNNSGCGGAAIFRNKKGEKILNINTSFPHWFTDTFKNYNNRENELPFDQHELLALIAPRPIYVASASLDQWADPENEFLSIVETLPVYKIFNIKGLNELIKPAENVPQIGVLSYHLRKGNHDITPWDWENYIKFADKFIR